MRGLVVMPRVIPADGGILRSAADCALDSMHPFFGKMLSTPLKPTQHANQTSSGVKHLKT